VVVALELIGNLIRILEQEGISYCHWKSNAAMKETMAGEDDLDLLAAQEDKGRFLSVLARLNFIRATAYNDSWFPDITHYYGYDSESGKVVHVHLHFKLILGYDLIKNYHLPLEDVFLRNAGGEGVLKTPACELDLIVFVIRMVLKRRLICFLLGGPRYWLKGCFGKRWKVLSKTDRRDLKYLQGNVSKEKLEECRREYFPFLSGELFDYCLSSIGPGAGRYGWFWAGRRLVCALKGFHRYGAERAVLLAVVRRLKGKIKSLFRGLRLAKPTRKRLSPAGKIIAFVGGDGAGKTTNIRILHSWLGRYFDVRSLHVGRPTKGVLWYFVIMLLRIRKLLQVHRWILGKPSDNFHRSVKYLLMARYRYRAFCKAVRLRSRGVLVLLDRIPLPGLEFMDKPRIRDLTGGRGIYGSLAAWEEKYHREIRGADELIVLRLDPKIAAHRRPEDEQEKLADRSRSIWERKWPKGYAHLIDSSQPLVEVEREIRDIVWTGLRRQVKIIELIGPAGAGKSAVAERLLDETCNVQTSLSWKKYRMKCVVRLLPKLVSLLCQKVPFRYLRYLVNLETNLTVLQNHKSRWILPCCNLVLDEGPVFRWASLKQSAANSGMAGIFENNSWLQNLEARIGEVLDTVVWLDAPDEVLRARINQKVRNHRMKDKPEEIVDLFLNDYRRLFTEIVGDGTGKIAVKRFDTEQVSIEDVLEGIKALL